MTPYRGQAFYAKGCGDRMGIVGKAILGYSTESQVSQISRIYSGARIDYTVASCGRKWGTHPKSGSVGDEDLRLSPNPAKLLGIATSYQVIVASSTQSAPAGDVGKQDKSQMGCADRCNQKPCRYGEPTNRNAACFLANSATPLIASQD
jgi:hypothetical protein